MYFKENVRVQSVAKLGQNRERNALSLVCDALCQTLNDKETSTLAQFCFANFFVVYKLKRKLALAVAEPLNFCFLSKKNLRTTRHFLKFFTVQLIGSSH